MHFQAKKTMSLSCFLWPSFLQTLAIGLRSYMQQTFKLKTCFYSATKTFLCVTYAFSRCNWTANIKRQFSTKDVKGIHKLSSMKGARHCGETQLNVQGKN